MSLPHTAPNVVTIGESHEEEEWKMVSAAALLTCLRRCALAEHPRSHTAQREATAAPHAGWYGGVHALICRADSSTVYSFPRPRPKAVTRPAESAYARRATLGAGARQQARATARVVRRPSPGPHAPSPPSASNPRAHNAATLEVEEVRAAASRMGMATTAQLTVPATAFHRPDASSCCESSRCPSRCS